MVTALSSHKPVTPMSAVDLFSGAGGFSLGLRRAGFNVVLANEASVDAEWTYRANLLPPEATPNLPGWQSCGDRRRAFVDRGRQAILALRQGGPTANRCMVGGDIAEVLSDQWLESWLSRTASEVDLLVAGPPCQGFSVAGSRADHDARNDLIHEAVRVIEKIRPRTAVIENVPGLLARRSDILHKVGLALSRLEPTPYSVCIDLLDCSRFGVPQTRKRIIMVAIRSDLLAPDVGPERLHSLVFPVACPSTRGQDPMAFAGSGDSPVPSGTTLSSCAVLEDLAIDPPSFHDGLQSTAHAIPLNPENTFLSEIRTPRDAYLAGATVSERELVVSECLNHESSVHRESVRRRMRALRNQATTSQEAIGHRCSSTWLMQRVVKRHPDLKTSKRAQRVLLPNEWPMLTVTSLPDDIVHFEADRIPTVREVARLQTFPDWFAFFGVRTSGDERRAAGIHVPQYTQVANAVPARLAHAVAARLRQFLLRVEADPSCSFELEPGPHVSDSNGTTARRLDQLNATFVQAAERKKQGQRNE